MDIRKRINYNITRFYPPSFKRSIRQNLIYTQSKIHYTDYIGNTFLISVLLTAAAYILQRFIVEKLNIANHIIALVVFIGINFTSYVLLFLKSEKIKDEIEKTLPDVLQMVSSNLDAGSTPYQAMRGATREEFGVLGKLFDKATKKSLASESFEDCLQEITTKTNSVIFKRAIKLITSSLKTGSHLSNLLKELAEDIADRRALKEEMVTNTKTYTMFIMFTIIMGAPLLFAISIHFVSVVNNLQNSANITTAEFGLGFLAGGVKVTPEFLTKVSYASLLAISFIACMMMGVITSGEPKRGIKYVPIIVFGSILMFIIAKKVVLSMFGTMI